MKLYLKIILVLAFLVAYGFFEIQDTRKEQEEMEQLKAEFYSLLESETLKGEIRNNHYGQEIELSDETCRYFLSSLIKNLENATPRNRNSLTEYNIDIVFCDSEIEYTFFTRFDCDSDSAYVYYMNIDQRFGFEDQEILEQLKNMGIVRLRL